MPESKPQNSNIDNNLFIIGGLVTLVLTLSAILNLNNPNSLLTLVLFIPIPIYFLFLFFKKTLNSFHKFLNIQQKQSLFFGEFNLKEFLLQPDTHFLVTIILISLLASILMYQASYAILK